MVVGGGPTGVEFAAELADLVHEDLKYTFPEVRRGIMLFRVFRVSMQWFFHRLLSFCKMCTKNIMEIMSFFASGHFVYVTI